MPQCRAKAATCWLLDWLLDAIPARGRVKLAVIVVNLRVAIMLREPVSVLEGVSLI